MSILSLVRSRIFIALLVLGVALVVAAACGDDDDATPTITPGPSSSVASTTAPADDRKTTGPSESPGDATIAPTAPGDVPTAPPTASEGTPAVAPDDEGAFIGQFFGQPYRIVEYGQWVAQEHDLGALGDAGQDGSLKIHGRPQARWGVVMLIEHQSIKAHLFRIFVFVEVLVI